MCENDLDKKCDIYFADETGLYGVLLDKINENGTLEFLGGDRKYLINPASPNVYNIEIHNK